MTKLVSSEKDFDDGGTPVSLPLKLIVVFAIMQMRTYDFCNYDFDML